MLRYRRFFATALVLTLVQVLAPAATGNLSPLAPSTGTPDWGTGTARGPVKCNAADVTPDGRVFPEPQVSATFLTFNDFRCGIHLLADLYPDEIDIEIFRKKSASGHPIYNVKVTNEHIPNTNKRHLFILNSIHGNEPAGREGAARVIEDMVDPRFMARERFIEETMDRFVVHFVFGNPDGWINGDFYGHNDAGITTTRTNNGGRDLNRNFPVQGFLRSSNGTLDQHEGQEINSLFLRHADTEHDEDDEAYRGWYLGTDNHGQGAKPVAASGLQIVGQFDYEKSERLAHFADGIEGAMAEYGVLDVLQELNMLTDGAVRPYEWGTLYDILGYSASGSGIDYYNTPGVVNGTGFATEMTASNNPYNFATHPHLLNQMWVNSVRAINYTMMRDAVNPPSVEFPVGGKAAYVFDPAVVTDADADGFGKGNENVPTQFTGDDPEVEENFKFRSYSVTRMKFFEDLNKYATDQSGQENPLDAIRVPGVIADPSLLEAYDTIVLADNDMPEGTDRDAWVAALRTFVERGGNLILTDKAALIIDELVDGIEETHITMQKSNVGHVDFPEDRSHPLNAGLRGVASQTYDVIPIGYPDNSNAAPNWRVDTAAWEAAGGTTTGTMGGQTAYGELPLGEGRIRFLGALLPQPTEDYFHPYGLQNYAVTYTGYTLLQNMLVWSAPDPEPTPTPTETTSPTPTPSETVTPTPTETTSPSPQPSETVSPEPTPDPTPSQAADSDGDGVEDESDNCPQHRNPDQMNTYGDARGDACEPGQSQGGGGGGGSNTTPSPTPTEEQSQAPPPTGSMTSSIESDAQIVRYGRTFTLAGRVSSTGDCDPGEVELSRRVYGDDRFERLAVLDVGNDGTWTYTGPAEVNSSYIAAPTAAENCTSSASSPEDVQVRAKIRAVLPTSCRGAVSGKVVPANPDTRIVLQTRTDGAWKRADSDTLNGKSRFSVRPGDCGRFRLWWKGSHLNLDAMKTFQIAD